MGLIEHGDCPRCREPKDDPRIDWGPGEWADEVERLNSQLAGAVEALREARDLLVETTQPDDAGFYDDDVWGVLKKLDAALGGQS